MFDKHNSRSLRMILFNLILFLVSFIHYSAGQQCSEGGQRKFDLTFAKLLTLGSSGRRFPQNKQDELKLYCQQTSNYIDDIDKYKAKCMQQLPKQVTGVIVYSVKTQINQLCKKDSKRLTDLVASAPCVNSAKTEYNACYSNLIDTYHGLIHAPEKKRIPHICCEYYKFYECLNKKALKNKNCKEEQIENFNDFFRTLFGNVVDLLCGDYIEGSDKCDKLEPPPKKKKNQRRAKSFMIPMIDVLASFAEL